jgi:hypothetical protein
VLAEFKTFYTDSKGFGSRIFLLSKYDWTSFIEDCIHKSICFHLYIHRLIIN